VPSACNSDIEAGVPLDRAFIDDAPYGPEGILIDEILEIRPEDHFVSARMPTSPSLPITRSQRTHEARHPSHVSGGLMVHMTGVIAMVHAYYVLGLRHREGWIGYGVRIHDAKYHKLANTTDPLVLTCTATRIRKIRDQLFGRYRFEFFQNDAKVYEGDQSAIWSQVV
jgi:hypothetical protein